MMMCNYKFKDAMPCSISHALLLVKHSFLLTKVSGLPLAYVQGLRKQPQLINHHVSCCCSFCLQVNRYMGSVWGVTQVKKLQLLTNKRFPTGYLSDT